ncbi:MULTISPECIES: hypothetical protein [unclassified Corallococcus]|uniref:hypothetical protein n=1 Tax=unclassified Corallococcus TaxID=2685029 RepID=UPI001A8FE7E9|nr:MULTISPECIES: hypothetical protein [unclassified Corallococcus]MBN9687159.1 hypothetical protein [Corallococcus sp. NCSPR001]WAS89014.1 hypothetical protein O0N60_19025 [Corallococcus sp. NCRR]
MDSTGDTTRASELLQAAFPGGITVAEFERAAAVVLKAVGWTPKPPPHQRVGALVRDALKGRGPMTYEQLQEATGLSVGAVSNGLKASGAIVVRQFHRKSSGSGSGKPTNVYGLPNGTPAETTPAIMDDGHIQACGNGGEDWRNCSPECRKAQKAAK